MQAPGVQRGELSANPAECAIPQAGHPLDPPGLRERNGFCGNPPYDPDYLDGDGRRMSPPATTLVVAVMWGDELTFGCIRDSRAYAGGSDGLVQRTRDDSWLQKMLDDGESETDALADPGAHAISRCVGLIHGAPDLPPFEPALTSLVLPAGGRGRRVLIERPLEQDRDYNA